MIETGRELSAEEDGWLRHDQVGLEVLPTKGGALRSGNTNPFVGSVRGGALPALSMPGLKVRGLGWADTEQDSQHFRIGDPLSQRWVEAGATLLDKRKMEARRVGDRLDVVIGGEVAIVSGNCRKLPFQQTRDGWWKRVTEIGVLRAAAVPNPPTGVHGELHEVGEPSDLLGACRFTARQSAKLIQIDGIGALAKPGTR